MPRLLRPLTRAVTYTRWLHLLAGAFFPFAVACVYPGIVDLWSPRSLLSLLIPVPLVLLAALVPSMRLAEGLQARVMLFPGRHARVSDGRGEPGVSRPAVAAAPSASWRDRGRTALWVVLRVEAGCAAVFVTVQLLALSLALLGAALGARQEPGDADPLPPVPVHGWAAAPLVPVPVAVLMALVVVGGLLMAGAAKRLLGPSARERLARLEERTELLLERNRIARELHDSIGHALTVAVVQAGAARAAADPAFTDRALDAIEKTGRTALEDLDRVLLVLREAEHPVGGRPTLAEAGRLLDSARTSGAAVDAEVTGALERVPGPVSREGYRMLQESLTNVLRHAGPVPVRVRISVAEKRLEMDVRSPLAPEATEVRVRGGGSGLRGVRERATLLGGRASAGPRAGEWQVHVELPLG